MFPMPDKPQAALQSLLDFYAESGVDCALDETPRDRFADGQRPEGGQRPGPDAKPAADRNAPSAPARRMPAQAAAS